MNVSSALRMWLRLLAAHRRRFAARSSVDTSARFGSELAGSCESPSALGATISLRSPLPRVVGARGQARDDPRAALAADPR
jgi:hypothetical protein